MLANHHNRGACSRDKNIVMTRGSISSGNGIKAEERFGFLTRA
ncbi:hypothetical protein [Methylovirgula ligni]|nr:hypothetical protein [Methylovirgula ligni]